MARKPMDQETLKADVLARMRRIEGQVRGIQHMVDDGKECEDILVQVRAVRAALSAATCQILRRYLLRCDELAAATGDRAGQSEKLMRLLTNFMDG